MSIKPLLSFSSGELDPVLTDNVTLEKFQKGLATSRNAMIGKTGSVLSRFSRHHCVMAKNAGEEIKIYCPPNTEYVLEWGNLYVRVYTRADGQFGVLRFPGILPVLSLQVELAHALTEDDLPNMQFVTSKEFVYIFCAGKEIMKLELALAGSAFVLAADIFEIPPAPGALLVAPVGAPTGYKVDYAATMVINGEESLYVENVTGYNKPIAAGQSNNMSTSWVTANYNIDEINEVRFYSRPFGGGAYGFLGSTTKFAVVGPNTVASFEDIGSLPDFANGIQDLITKYGLNGKDVIDLKPRTGTVYQQRLLLTDEDDTEAIIASRPGHQNNFYRDFPYAADSALLFKAGTSGKADVLRFVESDGLVVFTTNGVYTSSGLLSINNIALDRRGGWIINDELPPLVVPGGVFFVDRSNTIRQLIFSQDILAYESIEQTIFSAHLFKKKTIKTWAFQDGLTPLILVTFSDGTFASFTYNYEHQMRAWTRHDSVYPNEQVEGTEKPDISYFVVNKNGNRSIEMNLPREVPVDILADVPDADKFPSTAFMDSIKTVASFINYGFDLTEKITVVPNVVGEWFGPLTLTNSLGNSFSATVGQVYRLFNPEDGSAIDLEVLSITSPDVIVVQPSDDYPEDFDEIFGPTEDPTCVRLYETFNVITGLAHLEGESVSVIVDGFLVASPKNDDELYPELIVAGGSITLPDDLLGAIIHVGRHIIADVKTLNISTVEQSPTLIESLNVSKVYIRVQDTKGLYVSNNFPEEANGLKDGSSVKGMENLHEELVPPGDAVLIGNKFLPPISKRLERTLPGNWQAQGQLSIRQVDPFHFQILSIIPDATVLPRGDR